MLHYINYISNFNWLYINISFYFFLYIYPIYSLSNFKCRYIFAISLISVPISILECPWALLISLSSMPILYFTISWNFSTYIPNFSTYMLHFLTDISNFNWLYLQYLLIFLLYILPNIFSAKSQMSLKCSYFFHLISLVCIIWMW